MSSPRKNHPDDKPAEDSTGLTRRDFSDTWPVRPFPLLLLIRPRPPFTRASPPSTRNTTVMNRRTASIGTRIRRQFLFEDGLIMMNNGTVAHFPSPSSIR